MNKQLFEQYRDTKNKIAELEKLAAELAPQVLIEMQQAGIDKVKLEDGSGVFSTSSRKAWKYSKNVTDAEASLKELKTKEQSDGTAKATETKILTFRGVQGDEE